MKLSWECWKNHVPVSKIVTRVVSALSHNSCMCTCTHIPVTGFVQHWLLAGGRESKGAEKNWPICLALTKRMSTPSLAMWMLSSRPQHEVMLLAVDICANGCPSRHCFLSAEVQFHLEVAISLCDSKHCFVSFLHGGNLLSSVDVDSTYAQDRLFSQCLTAVVTAFAYHLHAATKARLNPASEYSVGPKEASYQWLEMVSEKGVLLCVQCLLLPSVVSMATIASHAVAV